MLRRAPRAPMGARCPSGVASAHGAPPAWRGCTVPVGGRRIEGAGVRRDRGSTIAASGAGAAGSRAASGAGAAAPLRAAPAAPARGSATGEDQDPLTVRSRTAVRRLAR